MSMCFNCHHDPEYARGLCRDCVEIRKKQVCKTCHSPGFPHNFRHPFEPTTVEFNMPIVVPSLSDPCKDGRSESTAMLVRIKWDRRFMEVAQQRASWSKHPTTKVGAVITTDARVEVGHGYNGWPRGVTGETAYHAASQQGISRSVHAELNAVLNATGSVQGCSLYCTLPPCHECAKVIIQSGIRRVVIPKSTGPRDRWPDSAILAREMFEEAGLELDTA